MRNIIILEGANGVGKTTLAKALTTKLNSLNIKTKYFRDPGGCEESEAIRDLIMKYDTFSKDTQLLLFFAARKELFKKEIDALDEDITIVLDRFIISTMVYQESYIKTKKIWDTVYNANEIKDINFITIYLNADDTVIKNRLANRVKEDANYFENTINIKKKYDKLINILLSSDLTNTYIGPLETVDIESDDIDNNTEHLLKILEDYGINNSEFFDIQKEILDQYKNNTPNELLDEFEKLIKSMSLEELKEWKGEL